ncbi:MAG: histidinol-phosphatase [bacterium]|nr:histidinol-phosphatase [bacterium]
MKQAYAFLDRDGALIFEPQDDYQIDSLKKLKILNGVIDGLQKLITVGFKLVMISNQDGRGTDSFPEEKFLVPQNRMLEIFLENKIEFAEIFICPHFLRDSCVCRKPKLGLVEEWIKDNEIDEERSFMYGDRESDGEFAKNLKIKFIKTETNSPMNINRLPL